jgi:hypothetical protein
MFEVLLAHLPGLRREQNMGPASSSRKLGKYSRSLVTIPWFAAKPIPQRALPKLSQFGPL